MAQINISNDYEVKEFLNIDSVVDYEVKEFLNIDSVVDYEVKDFKNINSVTDYEIRDEFKNIINSNHYRVGRINIPAKRIIFKTFEE